MTITVCGIPLEYHAAEDGRSECYVAEGGVSVRFMRQYPTFACRDEDAHWYCYLETVGLNVTIRNDGTPEQAAIALEAAVLKDFGHKLAFMRWLLEQT